MRRGGGERGGLSAGPIFAAVVRPLETFFRLEASSGIVLLLAAAAALAWANVSPEGYRALVHAPVSVSAGPLSASFTVHALVNDGLMTLFFFVVGMEIKHELALGELRTMRQAALPLVAALGGMAVPAGIYLAFNAGGPGAAGWGVPMATDIAFAIGVLTLLRARVSHALVVFLTALAIFDDIGGILVIALFYGEGIQAGWLAACAAVTAGLVLLSRMHVQRAWPWAVAGALLWYALHHAGVHATIAGVVLGLAVPPRPRIAGREVIEALGRHVDGLAAAGENPDEEEVADENVRQIEKALEAREAPLDRFTEALHPWVAFGVMPVFALTNAGVELAGLTAEQVFGPIAVGTATALLAGKLVGIFGFTAAAVRLGISPLPAGSTHAKLAGIAAVAGIGFTVALFIAGLAFSDPRRLDEAKLGIVAGSLAAGIVGAVVLRATPAVR